MSFGHKRTNCQTLASEGRAAESSPAEEFIPPGWGEGLLPLLRRFDLCRRGRCCRRRLTRHKGDDDRLLFAFELEFPGRQVQDKTVIAVLADRMARLCQMQRIRD